MLQPYDNSKPYMLETVSIAYKEGNKRLVDFSFVNFDRAKRKRVLLYTLDPETLQKGPLFGYNHNPITAQSYAKLLEIFSTYPYKVTKPGNGHYRKVLRGEYVVTEKVSYGTAS